MHRDDVVVLLAEVRERFHALRSEFRRLDEVLPDDERQSFARAVRVVGEHRAPLCDAIFPFSLRGH
jgi:hypothetical protein